MPDRDKVIKVLKSAASLVWNSNEGQCEIMDSDDALTVAHAIRDALELLKEQEPVKPVETWNTYLCGNCNHNVYHEERQGCLVLYEERYTYCPNCGRKVKWDAPDRC